MDALKIAREKLSGLKHGMAALEERLVMQRGAVQAAEQLVEALEAATVEEQAVAKAAEAADAV